MGPNGRQKIDFRPSFKAAGLEKTLDEVIESRNQELAHYGGLNRIQGQISDDRAILVINNDGDTYISSVYKRWNSERNLAIKLSSIIECALGHSVSYKCKKQEELLSLFSLNQKLRQEVVGLLPGALFDRAEIFDYEVGEFGPSGSTLKISW